MRNNGRNLCDVVSEQEVVSSDGRTALLLVLRLSLDHRHVSVELARAVHATVLHHVVEFGTEHERQRQQATHQDDNCHEHKRRVWLGWDYHRHARGDRTQNLHTRIHKDTY